MKIAEKILKYVLENYEKCPEMSWNCPGIDLRKILDTLSENLTRKREIGFY